MDSRLIEITEQTEIPEDMGIVADNGNVPYRRVILTALVNGGILAYTALYHANIEDAALAAMKDRLYEQMRAEIETIPEDQ